MKGIIYYIRKRKFKKQCFMIPCTDCPNFIDVGKTGSCKLAIKLKLEKRSTNGDKLREMNNDELSKAIVSIHELLESFDDLYSRKVSNKDSMIKYVKEYLDNDINC